METAKEKEQRFKPSAELFFEKEIPIYLKDINNDYFFAYINQLIDGGILIHCFGPKQREGMSFKKYYAEFTKFTEYQKECNTE